MPDLFWGIFKCNRWLLNALFTIAASTLLTHGKTKKVTPGIFAALHTYGRQLNFNSHIHLSVAKYGVNQHGELRVFSFPFSTMMSQWRYGIISLLRKHFEVLKLPDELLDAGKNRRSWHKFLDSQYHRSWNVGIAKNTTHKSHTAKYLGAYIKKPPISASRLAHYHAGEVSFTYLDHYTKTYKTQRLTQKEMVTRILSHVPEKHFKMIRYYGFLANRVRSTLLPVIYNKLGQERQYPPLPTFASMMKAFRKTDPFECILCGSRMLLSEFTAGLKLLQLVHFIKDIAYQR
jgi:hypothetical protein